jgi:hypothetical protein
VQQSGVARDREHRLGERRDALGLDEKPVDPVLHDVRDLSGSRADDRSAALERLDRVARQPLRA